MTADLLLPFGNEGFEEDALKLSTKHKAHGVPVLMLGFARELIERILRSNTRIDEALRPIYEICRAERRQL